MMNHGFQALTSVEHLDAALATSHHHPVAIFKHSTRCGVSAEALEVLASCLQAWGTASAGPGDLGGGFEVWMITVPAQREMSNEAAARLGIRHESPQLIVLRDGAVAWHGSHFRITPAAVESALGEPTAAGR